MRPFQLLCLTWALLLLNCRSIKYDSTNKNTQQYITVLGTVQDAGYPHINNPEEFSALHKNKINKGLVVSLGLVDNANKKKWLFEATPDMPQQLYDLEYMTFRSKYIIDGVFLTHAHIGHYTGLMYFGREAMGSSEIPIYTMPLMQNFLKTNQPWKQLIDLKNINIKPLVEDLPIELSSNLKVTPFIVPHRDEHSETVGFKIQGKKRSLLFVPDINKWELWKNDIIEEVKKVDYALIDATFFKEGEILRPMSEVPHPFIDETVELFKNETLEVKSKIFFIHLNHSNPALSKKNVLRKEVEKQGFNFAYKGQIFSLD